MCSCYPWQLLGLPPSWYKDPAYRARIVREPRLVLSEMGLELADDVEITVHDSSSEVRWLVLPEGTVMLVEMCSGAVGFGAVADGSVLGRWDFRQQRRA